MPHCPSKVKASTRCGLGLPAILAGCVDWRLWHYSASKSSANNRIALLEAKLEKLEAEKKVVDAKNDAWKNVGHNLMELDELIRSGQKEAAVERSRITASEVLWSAARVERFKKEVAISFDWVLSTTPKAALEGQMTPFSFPATKVSQNIWADFCI